MKTRKPSPSRRRPCRRRSLPRRAFDAIWNRLIDSLVVDWTVARKPALVTWTNGCAVLRLSDGRVYAGRVHEPLGTQLLVGTLSGPLDETVHADGSYPAAWPGGIDLWPMQMKVFKPGKDGLRRGVAWLPHPRGRMVGEIYRITATDVPSGLAGVAVPLAAYRHVGPAELASLVAELRHA